MSVKALPGKLSSALKIVRSEHPLPGEFDPEEKKLPDELTLPLKRFDSGEWIRFCWQMDQRLERFVFPVLQSVSDAESEKRLLQLCRARCSWFLYEQAWHAFQLYFPSRKIQIAFAEIYATLRRDPKRYGEAPGYIRDYLPAGVDFSLSSDLLLQDSFKLFSDYMQSKSPDESFLRHRNFGLSSSETIKTHSEILRKNIRNFFKNYGIILRSRFGSALLGMYLLSKDERILFEERELFSEILPSCPEDQFISFLSKINRSALLTEEERSPLFLIILKTLELLPDAKDLWKQMPRRTRQNFLKWHIWTVIQEHFEMNPRKELVYKHFSRSMSDVIELDSQTVAFRFPSFYILDSWDETDFSYYYPKDIYESIFSACEPGGQSLRAEIPCRILSDDNMDKAVLNPVKLSFVMPGLSLSSKFLSVLTSQKPPDLSELV